MAWYFSLKIVYVTLCSSYNICLQNVTTAYICKSKSRELFNDCSVKSSQGYVGLAYIKVPHYMEPYSSFLARCFITLNAI